MNTKIKLPTTEQQVKTFFSYLKTNGNIEKLGTNEDNKCENVHKWFSFLPGFSHIFVRTTINHFYPPCERKSITLFDPFMGSATTAVVAKELGISAIGNESNPFLFKIGKGKIQTISKPGELSAIKRYVLKKARRIWKKQDAKCEHKVLSKCYDRDTLKKLISLRNICRSKIVPNQYKPYLFISISSLLSKCAKVGISIPYISWSHIKKPEEPFCVFDSTFDSIINDLLLTRNRVNSGKQKIYCHDSRKKNSKIRNSSIDLVFTSPPYLNNFDYGEALKVHTYFWGITSDWSDITEKVRKKSLTSATTHYREKDFISKKSTQILGNALASKMPSLSKYIVGKMKMIQTALKKKNREKSFDILTALYFKDMYDVLKEVHRVLKPGRLCCIVIGDSAPYGVYVPTDEILGKIGLGVGFAKYWVETLRLRGHKWKTLKNRHKIKLRESILILKK